MPHFPREDLDEGPLVNGLDVISTMDDVESLTDLTFTELDLPKISPREILFNNETRQYRKAVPLFDQTLDCLVALRYGDDMKLFEARTVLPQEPLEFPPGAGAFLPNEEWDLQEIPYGEELRERAVSSCSEKDKRNPQQFPLEKGSARGSEAGHSDVERSGEESLKDLFTSQDIHDNAGSRIFFRKGLQGGRKQMLTGDTACSQSNSQQHLTGGRFHGLHEFAVEIGEPLCVASQLDAAFGQVRFPPVVADHERGSKVVLKLLDLHAHRRLGEEQRLSGPGKAALFRHFQEHPEGEKTHFHGDSACSFLICRVRCKWTETVPVDLSYTRNGSETSDDSLLDAIDIQGKTTAADAIPARREFAHYLAQKRNAHCHFTVKANLPTLPADIELCFRNRQQPDFIDHTPPDHERIESRKICLTSELNDYLNFPHVAQALDIERHSIDKKTGKCSREIA